MDPELKSLFIALTGMTALIVSGCTGKITREVNARLLGFEQSVSLEDSTSGNAARAIAPRMSVRKGELVRTGGEGRADLMLLPGALLELGPNAAIRLEELSLTKNGNALDEAMSRLVLLRVMEGTALLVIQFESEPGQFQVVTPNGVLSTGRPGTFLVQVEGDQTRITCIRGAGTFGKTGDDPVSIEAGFFRVIPSNVPDPTGVETDSKAQEDVDYALNVERKLLNLQVRERDSPFPWRLS